MDNDVFRGPAGAGAALAGERGRRISAAQMARVGVRLLNKYGRVLRCESCGASWCPQPAPGGSLPSGFWHCPNRCNW